MVSWCGRGNIVHKHPQNQSYVGSTVQTLTTNVSGKLSYLAALHLVPNQH